MKISKTRQDELIRACSKVSGDPQYIIREYIMRFNEDAEAYYADALDMHKIPEMEAITLMIEHRIPLSALSSTCRLYAPYKKYLHRIKRLDEIKRMEDDRCKQ